MNPALQAERLARESYGRLLAQLASRTRDVAAAEDALSEAFAAALRFWPKTGAPDNPEAWLFAAAKRKFIDAKRRAQTAFDKASELARAAEEIEAEMSALPDRRLGLLFACAHPAIEAGARTALMLQTVLGLSAERIAAAFLVEPAAMGQRLVRAKRKIKEAGVPFDVPDAEQWPDRLACVLDAIYAAYAEGWIDAEGADGARRALAEEAIWLGRVLVALMPKEAEAQGLLALMLHLEARRKARRDATGAFVPLSEQDCSLWDSAMIGEAEQRLYEAAAAKQPDPRLRGSELQSQNRASPILGRYQLEAAIQSAHAARRVSGDTDWPAIVRFYGALAELTGSPVARLNRAAALAHAGRMEEAMAEADRLAETLCDYQPFWALKAHLLAASGRMQEARAAYGEAIARETDAAVIRFLRERL